MTTFWIDNESGDDGNTGTASGQAVQSLSKLVSLLTPGDTGKFITNATPYSDGVTWSSTDSGTSGNVITYTAHDPLNPPQIDQTTRWHVRGAAWLTFSYLDFNHGVVDATTATNNDNPTDPFQFGDGDNFRADNITIDHCIFRNSKMGVLRPDYTLNMTISNCRFYNIRRRIAGSDLNAIVIRHGAAGFLIDHCVFEDMGSDGFQCDQQGTRLIEDITIQNCEFRINTPYSTSTRDEQNFSDSVGENFLDFKRLVGPVIVRDCTFHHLQGIVAGQDCSSAAGADNPAVIIHNNTISAQYTFNRCRFYNCPRAIGSNDDSIIKVQNCLFDGITDRVFDFRCDPGNQITLVYNTIVNSERWLHAAGCNFGEVKNNVFWNCNDFNRSATTNEAGNWDFNLFKSLTSGPPSQWVGANDLPSGTTLGWNSYYAPGTSSGLLDSGTPISGITLDFLNQTRDSSTPTVGYIENQPTLASNVQFDENFSKMFISLFSGSSDSTSEVHVEPPWSAGRDWSLATYLVHPTTRHYGRMDLSASNKEGTIKVELNPNAASFASNTIVDFLTVQNSASTNQIIASFRKTSGSYFVAARIRDDSGGSSYAGASTGFVLNNGSPNLIQLGYKFAASAGANDGFLNLSTAGVLRGSVTGLNNDLGGVKSMRLGNTGASGTSPSGVFFLTSYYADSASVVEEEEPPPDDPGVLTVTVVVVPVVTVTAIITN